MTAVVSFTHLTMGKLMLRTSPPERLASLAAAAGDALMAHWTVRDAAGTLIVEVHADEDTFRRDYSRNFAVFSDPVHRFRVDVYPFADDENEREVVDAFTRAKASVAELPPPDLASDGLMRNHLLSLNHLPHPPDDVRAEVRDALHRHQFASVMHMALQTPQGEMLVDPYLDEEDLIDDFVFVRDVYRNAGLDIESEIHHFTDRAHERVLDQLVVALQP
ncbi:MAG TPA: hypothetical protein VFZ17_03600 [Acidimicrobiia bacterium]|nr:hypothetical protein [Acidimicrobiia bacterium]